MKKIILLFAATIFICSSVYALQMVSCENYLKATPYSHAVDKKHNESFMVHRHFHNGISEDKCIFPNGKIIHSQSRVVPGKTYCASYAKHWGHYVQYATYKIYKISKGYLVKVLYRNNDKQTLIVRRVKP